jgi:hypothetical protein
MPLPVSVIVTGAVVALLIIEMLADAFPVVMGLNITVKFMLVPVGTVSGAVNPDRLKPSPLIVACEITRSFEPGLDSLRVWLV